MSNGTYSGFKHRIVGWSFIGWSLFLVISVVLAAAGPHAVSLLAFVDGQTDLLDGRVPGGALMIVGGGAVTPDIRRHFVELAGGAHARIVLIPGCDPTPDGRERLLSPWRSSGIESILLLSAPNRALANDPR